MSKKSLAIVILQQAVETGVENMWRDVIISRYLEGDLTREEAIEAIDQEVIQKVDTAKAAIEDDIKWGLDTTGTR